MMMMMFVALFGGVVRCNLVMSAFIPRFEMLDVVKRLSWWSGCLCLHVQPLHLVGVLLLRKDFARIEFNQHGAVRF